MGRVSRPDRSTYGARPAPDSVFPEGFTVCVQPGGALIPPRRSEVRNGSLIECQEAIVRLPRAPARAAFEAVVEFVLNRRI